MRLSQTFFYCVLSSIILTTISCKKNQNPQEDISIKPANSFSLNDLKVKNGIMHFDSQESFQNAMKKITTYDLSQIEGRVFALKNFDGLIEKNNQLNTYLLSTEAIDTLFEEYEDSIVQDPYLQAMLNAKREIMIDSTIFRITERGVFMYKESVKHTADAFFDRADYNDYVKDVTLDFDPADTTWIMSPVWRNTVHLVQKYNLNDFKNCDSCLTIGGRTTINTPVCNWPAPTNSNANEIFGEMRDCDQYVPNDSKRRGRATVWSQNFTYYTSNGIKTRFQRRRIGIWWNVKTDLVSLQSDITYTISVPNPNNPLAAGIGFDFREIVPLKQENNSQKVVHRSNVQFGTFFICLGGGGGAQKGGCQNKIKIMKPWKFKKVDTKHEVWTSSHIFKLNIKRS